MPLANMNDSLNYEELYLTSHKSSQSNLSVTGYVVSNTNATLSTVKHLHSAARLPDNTLPHFPFPCGTESNFDKQLFLLVQRRGRHAGKPEIIAGAVPH